ncbi:hypothetical protein O7599_04065 [Streptomyces sp. WMMC500]|uniref:hypothetical protein n=1 Tax=Streptomyces sp. WMMC500 TaxID=3015154 RepID=UPI00248D1E36|nr:hypothetical protein [Streptomyces sp. WMMC500]WBB61737.1 hypothetical protein O7599_04065 [Streptomyces sp. WMMC500]
MRTIRAATFAALCVVLAAVGHVTMSGTPVPWWVLVTAAVTTGPAAWCLAGRERGLAAVTSAAVVAQAVLHAAFSLAQAAAQPPGGGVSLAGRWVRYVLCAPPEGGVRAGAGADGAAAAMERATAHHLPATHHGMEHGAGHAMGAAPARGSAGAGESAEHVRAMDHMGHGGGEMSSLGMLGAHLLVALLCGLWLAHGERAAFRVVRVLRALRVLAGWAVAPLRAPLAAPVPPVVPEFRFPPARAEGAPARLLVHSITSRGPPRGAAVI